MLALAGGDLERANLWTGMDDGVQFVGQSGTRKLLPLPANAAAPV